jgi:hypothetical protein
LARCAAASKAPAYAARLEAPAGRITYWVSDGDRIGGVAGLDLGEQRIQSGRTLLEEIGKRGVVDGGERGLLFVGPLGGCVLGRDGRGGDKQAERECYIHKAVVHGQSFIHAGKIGAARAYICHGARICW